MQLAAYSAGLRMSFTAALTSPGARRCANIYLCSEDNMTTEMKDNLLDWLRDAHAMEEQAEKMLTSTAERLENYPELRSRIEQHIEETRHQAEMVRGCIKRLGSDTSAVKDATGKMMAMAQGMSG